MFKHKELKARQRAIRDSFGSSLSLRTHRALSWLERAEQEAEEKEKLINEQKDGMSEKIESMIVMQKFQTIKNCVENEFF